ncbi:POL2 [Candida oxycetoniae]|uniref:DNA polymerase epsilon catalytic subunit A n=1 Tax=Candida oxycetoniae TaxID=497107 RepID=A0AAI9SZ75_9ASCO|nr:POL2 [Candida oxycetoniae]KAI3405326.2 POL2 [Candida oxycetoniae]
MSNPYGYTADAYQPQQPHLQHPQPQYTQPMQMPNQPQQPQHPQQRQFNFLNDPAAALASQFARSGFEQSNQYIQDNFGSFSGDIKYYFQVSNSYVLHKIFLILFPYRQKDWNRISTKETGINQFLPPTHDVNAPDLYIPLMSFVTYILLWAAFQGLKGDFHPQVFGYLASQSVAFSVIDIVIFKIGLYLLNCSQSKVYDIISFAGYKYVSIVVLLCLKHSVGTYLGWFYYLFVLVLIVNLSIFLMRSLRFIILPQSSSNGSSTVSNTVTSKQRKIRIQFLFVYSVIIQGIIILFMSKGSNSARYVSNKGGDRQGRFKTFEYKNKEQALVDPYVANNPMLNDSIQKKELVSRIDHIDTLMGFDRFEHGENDGNKPRKGWLINMHATTIPSDNYLTGYSGVDYYFLDEEGGSFKCTVQYDPYFFIDTVTSEFESEVEEWMRKYLENCHVKSFGRVVKEDLSLPNHLLGLKKSLIKLTFHNIQDLLAARRMLTPIIKDNQMNKESRDMFNFKTDIDASDPSKLISDIKEYDVPYHVRVAIDKQVRVGKWYNVYAKHSKIDIVEDKELIAFADPVVLAFDIETTKAPLKFPDSRIDQVMMISYMIDGEGFLITNREIIAEDIEDFEYTPKPEYPGLFTIFNEPDEKHVLLRFFEHIRDVRPTVIATFNGDFFDWPFIENRARFHDLDMFEEIGFAKDNENEYKSKYCVHMDCFRWVKRDSYLPQGSQGLKAVTTVKLGYNPTELDPELMTPYAYEKPQLLAEYSVSDAVATYYLYYKYVHPFIFSLCTIIPLNPDEVLRKGTGTLCEMLLSVQAYEGNILLPNKHSDPIERFYDGHLLESETYVGGHVESLEAGVFRSDIATDFKIDPTAIDELLGNLHNSIKFCIEVENNRKVEDVENFEEVYEKIRLALLDLKKNPLRKEEPFIYHVDVASMYPNIMTSNRLQPDSMKSEEDCAACDFNRPGKNCDRRLPWSWRGEYFPAEMNEYNMIKRTLQNETFPGQKPWLPSRTFDELSYAEQASAIKKRISDYSRKVYHRVKQNQVITREAIICQRENPFYVNTVRSFRDRRYEFKGLAKVWKGKVNKINKSDTIARDEANKMVVLYDSLQLAHKVILNSFYGYVMRKGSRWYSMEMAGVTCLTGATIIQMARALVERIGRPLELDTDGIWCILPKSFPDNFNLKCKDGKKIFLEYPCSMLNYLVHQQFTNDQYQDLVDSDTFKYSTRSDNSIFFEVDGPYKAMILPTSKEEGKGLKKRYAVFNEDGSLAELKGFELKRRGELQLIKNFQSDIFKLFLEGDSLETCYQAVATVANNWLDVLDTRGGMLEDEDLIELICENRSMSKSLAEYGNQKSTSITTAKRLGEFLGEDMVKDAGLATKYVISAKPIGAPVTERAIPVSIFSSEKKELYMKKWLKDPSMTKFSPRDVIDWDYYYERLASVVQKIITIPAALQNVKNPVPRVPHPDWLKKRIENKDSSKQQISIGKFFTAGSKNESKVKDIEDFGDIDTEAAVKAKMMSMVKSKKRKAGRANLVYDSEEEEKNQALLSGTCPSITEDYCGFLEYQKAKWSNQAQGRERRKKLFGSQAQSSQRSTVGGMFKKQAETIAGTNWEILEYKLDPMKPGDLKVYVSANGRIHTFNFHVPKKIYVTFKTPFSSRQTISGCEIESSNSILPNGHDGSHLYKFTMPQSVYQEQMSNVESVLQRSNILGIYESGISAIERAVIELGNTVRFDDTKVGVLGKGLKNGFNMKELWKIQNDSYLRKFDMDIVYLLHIVANEYEYFTVFKSWENHSSMFVLKPSAIAQELPNNNHKIYREVFQDKREKLDRVRNILKYPEEMSFETLYYHDKSKLLKKLNQTISKLHESRSSKALFAIQSPYTNKVLNSLSSTFDFPTVKMTVSELTLPAVGWQVLISKRVINHYFVLGSWIQNLISLAKYGGIPICNVQIENIGYLIDVEYARRLTENNIVLWWSPNPLPDHGGFESDCGVNVESLKFPTINNPEIYETACLEVEIGTLTINTILTSSLINEAEGTDLAEDSVSYDDNNNGASTFAVDSFSIPALLILKGMVKDWWDDALQNNTNADSIMNALITWVQRKDSFMYDPLLHYHVHNLSCKALLQLVNEFRKIGSQVVFANRTKLIIQTSKISVENSYAYGQYVLKAARSKPLFNFLDLKIIKYWDILIWMDEYNYGGRSCTEITNNDQQDLIVENVWQLKKYLPIVFQNEFEDWILIFLDSLLQHKLAMLTGTQSGTPRVTQILHILNGQRNKLHKTKRGGTKEGGGGRGGREQEEEEGEEGEEEENKNAEDLANGVVEKFRKPLLKRIEKLYRRQIDAILNPEFKQEYEFPMLPGSHLPMRNPALELVKFICAVFALSKKRNIEMRVLRKELLQIFDIKEFSDQAQFNNPSTSLIVPHVICDYCNQIRDIDICREEEPKVWNCTSCNKPYNKIALEEEIIAQFTQVLVSFYDQDLKCNKCSTIRKRNLDLFCKCSGSWVETVSYTEVDSKVHVFNNVSKFYNLQLLKGWIEECL